MSWGARIRAAIQGEVDGADVRALLAAGTSSASLRQGLADRRLAAELAHLTEEWRVALDLEAVAAPLWLADALTTLAGSLVDAEAEAHPDAPGMLSALTHQRTLALLQPVATLIAETSAALADPHRPSMFRQPMVFGPGVDQSALFLPTAYLRGLLQGANRLEGMAQVALEDLAALAGRSPAPDWLTTALQRLRGELAAAQARLAMIGTRGAALLAEQARDGLTSRQLESDLWAVINTYLRLGQVVSAPHLIAGAPRPGESARPVSPPAASRRAPAVVDQPAPPRSQAPPPPPIVERERALPRIEPSWQAPPVARATQRPPEPPREEAPRAFPRIDVPASAETRDEAHPIPEIGAVLPPVSRTAHTPRAAEMDAATPEPAARPSPRIDTPATPDGRSPSPSHSPVRHPSPAQPVGLRIEPAERWILSSRAARHRLRTAGAEDEAERRLAAFWEARAWTLSARGQAYLSEVAALVASGAVAPGGRSLSDPPYAPIYRVLAGGVTILDRRLNSGTLFAFDYTADRLLEPGPHDGVPAA